MARSQKDVVSYFPHDADASSSGDTVAVLQSRFGNDGYAFWFKLLEKLSSTEGHYLDCRSSMRWHLLLAHTGVNEITGVEIMNLLVEMEAIDKDLWESKLIWCQKLVNNVADVYKNRRRETPSKPVITEVNSLTTDSNPLTMPESTQSKVKETKVKETKVKEIAATSKEPMEIFDFAIPGWFASDNNDLIEDKEWFRNFVDEFKDVFNEAQVQAFLDYWSGAKPPKHKGIWKNRLRNWMFKAREIKQKHPPPAKTVDRDPNRFVTGPTGHMVARTKTDLKRIQGIGE